MEKKNTNKILIAVIIVLAVIVIALAAVIVGYMAGNRQAKDDIKKQNAVITVKETDIETTSQQETTTEQIIVSSKKTVDVNKYAEGIYLCDDTVVDDIVKETGGNYLNIKKIGKNSVSFEVVTIQSAPSSRIASVIIDDLKLDGNGVAKFKFDDDGWGNRGTGTIAFKGNDKVKINIKITRMSQDSMWNIGEGTVEYEYREDQKVPKLW